eukprot:CAMPEP_0113470726 /NCGR_PEP_ID=MMETSP0014_2-20120614/16598_1 /TAXON_ID=2857 /ORGANISM="Nitzschia sp." /LENGTH=2347 /DNA_ID=CAMNT_0000363313 /DNA_START=663 /DNA_END=7706 /DNA_ORIENTATION=+ /assembly_acc=CAM_ASM_000159
MNSPNYSLPAKGNGVGGNNSRYREPPSPSGSDGFFPQQQQQPQQLQSYSSPSYSQQRNNNRRSGDGGGGGVNVQGNSDQLAHQKKQWNVQRDIPSGTVRNNPFLPQPEPEPQQPVQLVHQKKQWDTSGIPKGAVRNNPFLPQQHQQEMEQRTASQSPRTHRGGNQNNYGRSNSDSNSPRTAANNNRSSAGRIPSPAATVEELQSPALAGGKSSSASPAAAGATAATTTSGRVQLHPKVRNTQQQQQPQRQNQFSNNASSSRGRMIEDPNMHQRQQQHTTSAAAASAGPKSWQPSREIPKGTVKGRMTSLFGGDDGGGHNNNNPKMSTKDKDRRKEQEDDEEEDPWIIPDRQVSTNSQIVSSNEWGEAVVSSTKSGESDDWDTPAKDWIKSSDSDEISPSEDFTRTVGQQQLQQQQRFRGPSKNSATGGAPASVRSGHSTDHLPQSYEGPPGGAASNMSGYHDDGFDVTHNPFSVSNQMTSSNGTTWQQPSRMDTYREESSPPPFSPREGDAEILKAAKDKSLLQSFNVGGQAQSMNQQQQSVRSPAATANSRSVSLAPPARDASAYHQPSVESPHQPGRNPSHTFGDSFADPQSVAFSPSFRGNISDDGFMDFDGVQNAFPTSAPSPSSKKKNAAGAAASNENGLGTMSGTKSDAFGFPQYDSPIAPDRNVPLVPRTSDDEDNEVFFDAMAPSSSNIDEPVHAPIAVSGSATVSEASTIDEAPTDHAPVVAPSHKNVVAVDNDDSDDETEENEDEPKQKRRGFLGKLFGRGGKSKSTSSTSNESGSKNGKKSKKSRKERGRKSTDSAKNTSMDDVALKLNSRATNNSTQDIKKPSPRDDILNIDTRNDHGPFENQHDDQKISTSESDLKKGKSQDNKTISDIAIPGVVKDGSRKAHVSPAQSTIASKSPSTQKTILESATPKASSSSSKLKQLTADHEDFVDPSLDHLDMSEHATSDEDNPIVPEKSAREPPPLPPTLPAESAQNSGQHIAKTRHMQNRHTSLLVKDNSNAQTLTEVVNERRRLSDRNPSRKPMHNEPQPNQVAKLALVTKGQTWNHRVSPASTVGKEDGMSSVVSNKNRTTSSAPVQVQGQSSFARNLAARKNRSMNMATSSLAPSGKAPQSATKTRDKTQSGLVKTMPPMSSRNVIQKNRLPAGSNKGVHETSNVNISCENSTHSSASYDAYQYMLSERLRKAKKPVRDAYHIDDYSARSGRTITSHSSLESDVRVLRQIIRRPRKDDRERIMLSRSPNEFPVYDQDSVSDPMQRAGLRLLSAAIIPIQAEVRRFLAMRRALTRMWALIIIQTYTRRHLAQNRYERSITAITTIQAATRGHIARNDVITKHISAIEIQRHMRGYLATMRVYEEIYRVTLIQSWVRMRIAMDAAAYRMALVIQLQSVSRGFLVRKRIEEEHKQATVIQTAWRCFYDRLTYQFDLLDIIIVQSLWRMKLGQKVAAKVRSEKREQAATRIQTRWRAYDCRSVYVTYIAARKIQTKWRSYDCSSTYRRYIAARKIQTTWRSYDCKMNYIHFLADVLIVQSAFRRRMAQKRVHKIKNDAATLIQSSWRGFVCYADYEEYKLARKIQTAWRRYACQKALKRQQAATTIQLAWYPFAARKRVKRDEAATTIQSAWRGFVCYADYMFTIADVVVAQKMARGWLARSVADRKRTLIRENAATTIQSNWRRFVEETEYTVMRYEHSASRKIQTAWRRFWCFSNFIISLDSSIQIQAQMRGYLCRKACLAHKANCVKSLSELKSESVTIGDREAEAASLIQRSYRGSICRAAFTAHRSATKIQKVVRGKQALVAVRLYLMARRIQRMWRGYIPRQIYLSYIAARRIQCLWRRYKAQDALLVNRGEYLAATLIQSSWRGFVAYTDYVFTMSDIVSAQKIARGYVTRKKYAPSIQANCERRKEENAAATTIQRHLRGYHNRQRYWYTLGCTMQIQSWWRSRAVVLRIEREARALLTLQCFARRIIGRQRFLERKFIFMLIQTAEKERAKKAAAVRIQEKMQTYLEQKQRDEAARVIQRFFLRVKNEVDELVRAAKRRKKWRRKMMKSKNRTNNVEDALLEDAWMNAVTSNGGAAADDEPFIRHYTHLNSAGHKHSGSETGSRTNKTLASSMQSTNRHDGKSHRLPLGPSGVPKAEKPSTIVRLHHDDDEASVLSQLTGTTMTYVHPSRVHSQRSRKATTTTTDMNDEFQLEEAFIDAEIYHAKERRQMEGTSRSRDSTRHNYSVSNRGYHQHLPNQRSAGGIPPPSAGLPTKPPQHYPPRSGGTATGTGPGAISITYSRGAGSVEGIGIERTWSRGTVTRSSSKDPDGTRHVPRNNHSSSSRGKNNALVNVLSASNNY